MITVTFVCRGGGVDVDGQKRAGWGYRPPGRGSPVLQPSAPAETNNILDRVDMRERRLAGFWFSCLGCLVVSAFKAFLTGAMGCLLGLVRPSLSAHLHVSGLGDEQEYL